MLRDHKTLTRSNSTQLYLDYLRLEAKRYDEDTLKWMATVTTDKHVTEAIRLRLADMELWKWVEYWLVA